MKTSRLTMKGQVTLPKELREQFGLGPGTRVAFDAEGDGIKVRPVRKTILDWAGTLRSRVRDWPDDEIRRRVKKAVADKVVRDFSHGK